MLPQRCLPVMPPPIVELKQRLFGSDTIPDDCLNLNQAVPSYPPPDVVLVAAGEAARTASAARYTGDAGLPELRGAIAQYHTERHQADLAPEEVLVTAGANSAFSMLAVALASAGRPVHLVTPYYFNHAMAVQLCGGQVSEWRLSSDMPLCEALDDGRFQALRGETVALVNPSNPSGRAFSRSDVESLLERTKEWGAFLIVDETYLEFFPSDGAPVSLLSVPRWQENAAVVNTFSKSLAITGHRVGYVCASAEFLGQLLKVQDAFVICAPHVGQRAALAGLRWPGLGDWLGTRRQEMDSRVRAFCEAISLSGSGFEVESSGAFFAYVRHPLDADAWEVAEQLAREASVLVLPGSCCGSSEGGYLRVAVGNAGEETLRLAAGRMAAVGGRRS